MSIQAENLAHSIRKALGSRNDERQAVTTLVKNVCEDNDRLRGALQRIADARLNDFHGPNTMALWCVSEARTALAGKETGNG